MLDDIAIIIHAGSVCYLVHFGSKVMKSEDNHYVNEACLLFSLIKIVLLHLLDFIRVRENSAMQIILTTVL